VNEYGVTVKWLQPGREDTGRWPSESAEGITSMVIAGRDGRGTRVVTYIIDAETPEEARAEILRRAALLASHLEITVEPDEVTVERVREEAA
jgi:hypothetical protein